MSGNGTRIQLSDDWSDGGWFSFPRRFIRDRKLSWKAKGIAALLASHTSTFVFSASELEKWAKDGRDGTAAGVRELEAAGYLVRDRQSSGEMLYRLFPEPRTEKPVEAGQEPLPENPPTEKPVTEKPGVYKKTTPKETTSVGVTPGEISCDALFEVQAPPKAPTEPAPDLPPFEDFWRAYPKDRRVEKKAAGRAYAAALVAVPLAERPALAARIIDGAKRYAKERDGQPTKFTKHPTTWLTKGCWDDEPAAEQGGYRPYRDEDIYPDATPWFDPERDLQQD